ncbi:MAG TPA: Hpt domain-containing protein [Gemmatimonadaceae bacterium]|nr:Hpt domain-containing protein [Gemmatimonadaceae bacterium]
MSGSRAKLQAALARLRTRFAATAPDIAVGLDAIADRLDADPKDVSALGSLVHEMHRVHGTAGSHGFHEASAIAAAMERRAAAWLAAPAVDIEGRGDQVRAVAHDLTRALRI